MVKSKSKTKKATELLKNGNEAVEEIPTEPTFLKEDAIYFKNEWDEKESSREFVPPCTPSSNYDFPCNLNTFPNTFPDLEELEVPKVKEIGVKACIDILGSYFDCKDYKFDLLQFWFLDTITDCLWKAQDDFKLPSDLQKIALKWILYFMSLLKDVKKNYSRKEFFETFKEAILIAAEVVDEGLEVPVPEDLFTFVEQNDEESQSWDSSQLPPSSLKFNTSEQINTSFIQIGNAQNENPVIYTIPKESCHCDKFDLSSRSSTERASTMKQDTSDIIQQLTEQEESASDSMDAIKFYQPHSDTPPRFLEIKESEEEEVEGFCEEETNTGSIQCKLEDISIGHRGSDEGEASQQNQEGSSASFTNGHYDVYEVPDNFRIRSCAGLSASINENHTPELQNTRKKLKLYASHKHKSTNVLEKTVSTETTEVQNKQYEPVQEKQAEKSIMKNLAIQKMWEQRLEDMSDPRKGWIPDTEETNSNVQETSQKSGVSEENSSDDEEWIHITLDNEQEEILHQSHKQTMQFGLLWFIIDFMFKHFQFTLIKLAFQATPDIITQKVNTEWKVPKKIKVELQKPKVEKPKKKKDKKDKKSKSSKSSKKDKSKKGSKKSDKKSKSKTSKSSKKSKKGKKEKPVKLTKEQKAELERQRKEQERLEEERRKLEENKRFVFPLTDAATDELFVNIFENWVKVDLTKIGKQKGKGKKGKGKKK